jgi:hypothetical protein
VKLHLSGDVALLLYAPFAEVKVTGSHVLVGAVVGNQLEVAGQQKLRLAPGSQAVPPPLTCP